MTIRMILYTYLLMNASFAAAEVNRSNIPTGTFLEAIDSYNKKDLSTKEKEKVVKSILSLLDEKSNFEYRHYWKAVFSTFKCELKDKGKILPSCIISELSEIKSALKKAHKDYPSYHFCAPARTLGIMYFKMPAIAGGSNKKAFQYISEAHKCAPEFADNKKWYETIKKEM